MPAEVVLRNQSVDFDDKVGQVTAPFNGSPWTKIVFSDGQTNFRTRTGRKGRLMLVANAVDAGGNAVVTFRMLINGTLAPQPYNSFQQALGLTWDPSASGLAVPLDLPQNAMIEFEVQNTDDDTDYGAYIRTRVEYENL